MSGRDRNAPCPCGSGKKFKKCCGGAAQSTTTRFTANERAEARRYLESVLLEVEGQSALADVADALMSRGLEGVGELPDFVQGVGLEWRLDWLGRQRGASGRSLCAEIAGSEDTELTAGARAYLRALDTLPVRIYEIGQVHPGSGVTLWDATHDTELRVFSPRVAETASPGFFVAGRVLPVGPSGRAELDQPALMFPAEAESLIDAFLDDVQTAATEKGVALGSDEGFRRMSITLFVPWARGLMRAQTTGGPGGPGRPVGLTTTDGEPMAPTRVVFDVLDAEALVAGLATQPALEREGDGWTWLRPTDDPDAAVSIGKVTLAEGALTLECLSEARATRGRALVEAAAGAAVRHRETQSRSIQELLAETPAGGPGGGTLEAAVEDAVRARLQAVFKR
jgi:hypothetical protein